VTEWRLIDSGSSDAFYNMALDEAIATSVRGGLPPTLRFYEWDRPSVSIGCFQRSGDIDLQYCNDMGIPFVRRPTGGLGILHGNELTYSFSSTTKDGLFSGGLLDSYRKISHAFSKALSRLGISPETKLKKSPSFKTPLCFQWASYGEITVRNKKVIGSAQKRWSDGLLQQGSIPYSIDYLQMGRVFKVDHYDEAEKSMLGLRELMPELTPEALKEAIKVSFEEVFNIKLVETRPTAEEEALAKELLLKYRSSEWNLRR